MLLYNKCGVQFMIEYEYSIRAKSVQPFIDYCQQNGYRFVSKSKENRQVFENVENRKIISRITITDNGKGNVCLFDFKNNCTGSDTFKVAKESQTLQINIEDIEIVKNMLTTIGFEQVADNLRTRYVYVKDGIKFEIDEYVRPKMNVIGIEGKKEIVDKVYQEIKENANYAEYIEK